MSEKTMAEKLTDIANDIPIIRQKAYAEGYNNGIRSADAYETGYDQGVTDGKKAEYDAFWDAYQQNGNRTYYQNAFAGEGWTTETFKPKYDIKANHSYMIFRDSRMKVDLVEYLNQLGVVLDLSNSENTQYMFNNSNFTRLGVIDVRGSMNSCPLDGSFQNCRYLTSIDKVYLKTGSNGEFNNASFLGCNELVEIRFEGEITKSGLNMSSCTKLSPESLMSIITALKSGVSGLTCTLGTGNLAKLTDAEKAIATQKGWTLA